MVRYQLATADPHSTAYRSRGLVIIYLYVSYVSIIILQEFDYLSYYLHTVFTEFHR